MRLMGHYETYCLSQERSRDGRVIPPFLFKLVVWSLCTASSSAHSSTFLGGWRFTALRQVIMLSSLCAVHARPRQVPVG